MTAYVCRMRLRLLTEKSSDRVDSVSIRIRCEHHRNEESPITECNTCRIHNTDGSIRILCCPCGITKNGNKLFHGRTNSSGKLLLFISQYSLCRR